MPGEGEPCLDIAGPMAATRQALGSADVRMTVCFMRRDRRAHAATDAGHAGAPAAVLAQAQTLLGKVR